MPIYHKLLVHLVSTEYEVSRFLAQGIFLAAGPPIGPGNFEAPRNADTASIKPASYSIGDLEVSRHQIAVWQKAIKAQLPCRSDRFLS